MNEYVSQLPEGVPVVVLPGNHEQYSDVKWKLLTGNSRATTYVLGNNLFVMPDSFGPRELDAYADTDTGISGAMLLSQICR